MSAPRPSRASLVLDGIWEFQLDPGPALEPPARPAWRPVVVPMPWQAQGDDLRATSGGAWYRRHFDLSPEALPSAAEGAALLHFGAVDYYATVWVNEHYVGEHEGGYLPFEFEVSRWLQAGDNELRVRVIDPTDDRRRYAQMPFSEVPHGKQSWYGPIGGLWQSVWLEFRPRLHLARLRLTASPAEAAIAVQVELSDPPSAASEVVCIVTQPDGQTVGAAVLGQDLTGRIHLDQSPALWSPDSPALYTVTATLQVNGVPRHALCQTCGFRTVEARAGRIYLNGEPIYLRGALDQAYYPETIYTPPSLGLLEAQARTAKALGFNCLRLHIKVEDPRYYDVADRLGLLIWAEIPNWDLLTDQSAERASQTFRDMVARDGHHPAIIAWTLMNESWGADLAGNAAHRQWLAAFYHQAKAIDPTRLIVDNSACVGNAHVASDLEDFHYYTAIPDHARGWEAWVEAFANQGSGAWFPDFVSERRAGLPRLVSEFGNWGLPDPEAIQEHGHEPWWFETGIEWGEGSVYPHGVRQRYAACGLADLFPSYAEFSRQAQAHMARSLHFEISALRRQETIAGYVITEFTDVHWECNGLLTMQRQPKHQLDPLLKDLNQDLVVLLRPLQWSGRPGARLTVEVQTKGIAGAQARGAVHLQAGPQTAVLPAPGGNVAVAVTSPGVVTLSAQWLAEDGTRLAANQVDLVCVATEPAPAALRVVENPGLAATLRHIGYNVSAGAAGAPDDIVIADRYTQTLGAHLQNGGRVVWLAEAGPSTESDGEAPPMPLPVGQIVPRAGTIWQGDWATSLAWIRREGPLSALPGGPLLEMEWAPIMPDAVIAGLPGWVQRGHSYAGLTVGWVHKAVSLLAVLPYGRGQLLVTTFKLNASTLATEAMAQALFAGMLKLL